MLLRLTLVGMVAALGVTLPSQPKCEKWFGSAQTWARGVIADWDTWKPRKSENDRLASARGQTECPQCRVARARLAASLCKQVATAQTGVAGVSQPVSPTLKLAALNPPPRSSASENHESAPSESTVVAADLFSRVALELNRMTVGIKIPNTLPAPLAPGSAPAAVVVSSSPFRVPVAGSDDLDVSLLGELCHAAEATQAETASTQVTARTTAEVDQSDDNSFICSGFGDGVKVPVREVATAMPKSALTTETVRGDLVAQTEADLDFCAGADCGFDRYLEQTPTALRVASLPDLPGDVFGPSPEPIRPEAPRVASAPPQVVTPHDPSGSPQLAVSRDRSGPHEITARRDVAGPPPAMVLADLPRNVFAPLDRASERRPENPLERNPASVQTAVGHTVAAPRLGHAVELTRDALYAWMNILTGPALVDVTSH